MAENTNSIVDDDLDLTEVFNIEYYDFNWLISEKDRTFHTEADTSFNYTSIKWKFRVKLMYVPHEGYWFWGFEAELLSGTQEPLPTRIEANILPKGSTAFGRSKYRATITHNFLEGNTKDDIFTDDWSMGISEDRLEKSYGISNYESLVVAVKVQVINFRVIDDNFRLSRLFKDSPTPNRLTMDIKKLPEDVVIRCNKKEFKTHKFLLIARSEVFRLMFNNDMKESRENTIEIDDIEPRVVEEMLNYMYTDTVTFQCQTKLTKLIHAAHKYQLDHLELLCQNKLLKTLSVDSSVELLMLSDKYDLQMKKYVIMYMAAHAEKIFKIDEWKKLMVEKCELAVEVLEKVLKRVPKKLR